MANSRPSSRQLREFNAALRQVQEQSAPLTDSFWANLAAKRDAHLASLKR